MRWRVGTVRRMLVDISSSLQRSSQIKVQATPWIDQANCVVNDEGVARAKAAAF